VQATSQVVEILFLCFGEIDREAHVWKTSRALFVRPIGAVWLANANSTAIICVLWKKARSCSGRIRSDINHRSLGNCNKDKALDSSVHVPPPAHYARLERRTICRSRLFTHERLKNTHSAFSTPKEFPAVSTQRGK
jgi:hypothetical protein